MQIKNILEPLDEYNKRLLKNSHPEDWTNPSPKKKYNLVVIGAGTGGLVSAVGAANLGAKVAIIESKLTGGDCLNFGCVPSKAFIRSSRALSEIKNAESLGLTAEKINIDFGKVMERVRKVRAEISKKDSVERLNELGIDVFIGKGKFISTNKIEVNDHKLTFAKAIIATGTSPFIPPIKGLDDVDYHTNETIFNLTKRPARLAIIGGGPIGVELAQAFQRLATSVTLIHRGHYILNKEDKDAADIVQRRLIGEGVEVLLNTNTEKIETHKDEKIIQLKLGEEKRQLITDEILIATGRVPNIDKLGLDMAEIEYDKKQGIIVDDHLRTSNRRVFAVGDVALKYKFTHMSDATARIALFNALFWMRKSKSKLIVPWCTYTDPEIAHIGVSENEAEDKNIAVDTYRYDLVDIDRAVTNNVAEGLAKIHVKKGSDKILGATIVSPNAGEIISQISLAMIGGLGLKKIYSTIYPYPTESEIVKKIAETYYKSRLTSFLGKCFKRLLSFQI